MLHSCAGAYMTLRTNRIDQDTWEDSLGKLAHVHKVTKKTHDRPSATGDPRTWQHGSGQL